MAYHSTENISNVPLKKLLPHTATKDEPHTATKDELTLFLSKELPKLLNTVAWQNKAEASHRDGM